MRLTRAMTTGAVIGFVFGIIFTVLSAFQIDTEEATVGDAIQVGLFVGMPILVVMGTAAGILWDFFFTRKTPQK